MTCNRLVSHDGGYCIDRRQVLAGVSAGGLLALLGACTQDDDSAEPTHGVSPADVAEATAPAVVLTTTKAIPLGGGTVVNGILVVQPVAGRFAAYDAACPHMGAQLSPPDSDGVIKCNAHGSRFRDVSGALMRGPANRRLQRLPVFVDGDNVMV